MALRNVELGLHFRIIVANNGTICIRLRGNITYASMFEFYELRKTTIFYSSALR